MSVNTASSPPVSLSQSERIFVWGGQNCTCDPYPTKLVDTYRNMAIIGFIMFLVFALGGFASGIVTSVVVWNAFKRHRRGGTRP